MTKKLKDYGNGIMASSDDLASIGELYMREEMERQKQRALLRATSPTVEMTARLPDETVSYVNSGIHGVGRYGSGFRWQ